MIPLALRKHIDVDYGSMSMRMADRKVLSNYLEQFELRDVSFNKFQELVDSLEYRQIKMGLVIFFLLFF